MKSKVFIGFFCLLSFIVWAAAPRHITTNNEIMNGIATYARNQQAPANINVTASPFSWTNPSDYTINVFIGGGTVSAISLNGGSLASGLSLSGLSTVSLQPDEWVTVTYSSAPTVKVKPL